MRRTILILGLSAALAAGACTGKSSTRSTPIAKDTIPQPTVTSLPIADASKRVDLKVPTFSHPTKITNPLFPVSSQKSVLLLGPVDGKAFRTEVTLLPGTRIIEWAGQKVETLVSQYNAFLDGRIEEVAYDYYAQDDAGNVWYFGEDVFNFADGTIADTHGTWIAGKDGPAAMIMPAHPKVGDVYRPENIPGFVFEEVTIKSVDQAFNGPLGAIRGGIVASELHMDGQREDKQFAPGYGEFFTSGGGDVEALALAVPTDAVNGAFPDDLRRIASGALEVFSAAGAKDWGKAGSAATALGAAWNRSNTGAMPRLVRPRLATAVAGLQSGVRAKDVARARQAAIDVARLGYDLQLLHRPVPEIDTARFDLWAAQLQVDAAAENTAALNGDFFALDYVRDRIQGALDPATVTALNIALEELLGAIGDEDFEAVQDSAGRLRAIVS